MSKIIHRALSKLSNYASRRDSTFLLPKKVMYPTRSHTSLATTLPIINKAQISVLGNTIRVFAEFSNFPSKPANLKVTIGLIFETEAFSHHLIFRGFNLEASGNKLFLDALIPLICDRNEKYDQMTLQKIEFTLIEPTIMDLYTELWNASFKKEKNGKFY